MQETAVGRAFEVLAWTVWGLSWAFVILHTWFCWIERRWGRIPWWRTWLGWMWTTAVGALGTVLTFTVAADVWPWLALRGWYQWADVVAFGLVGCVVAAKVVARVVLHVRGRRAVR